MKIGEWLREIRQQRDLTLIQLSQKTLLSTSFLSDIERGQANPSIDTLKKIASSYGIQVGELVAGADGWQMTAQNGLAPGLTELIEQGIIDIETAQDLSRIELRGKRLQTAMEWNELYLHLRTLLRPYISENEL